MSSPLPSPTFSGTLTALLALTTPFVPSPDCRHAYDVVTETKPFTYSGMNYRSLDVFLVSDPAHSDFSLCQPSQYRPENGQSYSAGVCPSSWIYIDMSTMKVVTTEISKSSEITVTKTISTAMCCMDNHVLVATTTGLLASLGPLCSQEYLFGTTRARPLITKSDGGVESFPTTGREIHPAIWIAWEASDVSTLSPQPPRLTSAMRVPTWTAGEIIRKGSYDNNGTGAYQRTEYEAGIARGREYGLMSQIRAQGKRWDSSKLLNSV